MKPTTHAETPTTSTRPFTDNADNDAKWTKWFTDSEIERLIAQRGERYRDARVGTFEATNDQQQAVKGKVTDYVLSLNRNIADGKSVILYGPCGTGKDHLMFAMMRSAIIFGFSVEWKNGPDLYGSFRDMMDTRATESALIERLTRPAILALSDPLPGKGGLTDYQSQMLYRIVDRRYSKKKATWVTLNCENEKDVRERMDAPVIDRLKHKALVLRCFWESYRKADRGE